MRPPQLPSDIRALLAEAQPSDEPSPADRERIGRALAHTLGAPTEAWLAAPKVVAVKASVLGVKLLGLLAVLSLAGVGAWLGVRTSTPPSAAERAPAMAVQPGAMPSQPSAAEEPALPFAATEAARPGVVAARRSRSDTARSGTEPSRARDEPAARSANGDPRPTPANRAPRSSDSTSLTPAKPSQVASASEDVSAKPATTARPVLQDELNLITAASRALDAHDLASASQALRAHSARFAAGFLREEREALRAMVACERGDDDAIALRRAFERAHPRSPERPRIAQHCDHVR